MIIFTKHGLLKLAQRKIGKKFVLKTLSQPDYTKTSYGNRQMVFKKFGKLYLKVVFRKEGKNLIIITQHWVEKISP